MQAACSKVRCFNCSANSAHHGMRPRSRLSAREMGASHNTGINHFLTGSCHVPITLSGFAQGSIDAVDGRLSLVGWFIVAGVCLSPILIFSIAGVIGRWFLQRRLWQHVQRGASVVADRSALTTRDALAETANGTLQGCRFSHRDRDTRSGCER
jgi:hypothetical protein